MEMLIHFKGLHPAVTEGDLEKQLASIAMVRLVKLISTKNGAEGQGFVLVYLPDKTDTAAALIRLNNGLLLGKPVNAVRADPALLVALVLAG